MTSQLDSEPDQTSTKPERRHNKRNTSKKTESGLPSSAAQRPVHFQPFNHVRSHDYHHVQSKYVAVHFVPVTINAFLEEKMTEVELSLLVSKSEAPPLEDAEQPAIFAQTIGVISLK